MPRHSDRCCFSLIAGLVCGIASAVSVYAAPPRALPAGQVPKDVRLGAPKDLNGYFPLVVPKTKAEWEDVLTKMIEKGATGSEKELEAVFDYLVRSYGKVFINTAKADEIAAVLSLSPKDAEAIVAFRTANGKFADFDAVRKVPNIDVKKLDEHKDAVAF